MMPGDGIGPEMMGYVKQVFNLVGAPIDFEEIKLDPTTDNYADLNNVRLDQNMDRHSPHMFFPLFRPFNLSEGTVVPSKPTSRRG